MQDKHTNTGAPAPVQNSQTHHLKSSIETSIHSLCCMLAVGRGESFEDESEYTQSGFMMACHLLAVKIEGDYQDLLRGQYLPATQAEEVQQ